MRKVLLLLVFASFVFSKDIVIKIEKMHCPLCTTMIKKAIKKVDGVQKVKVRLNTKKAHVLFDESKTSTDKILEAIKTTSYIGVLVE